MPLSRFLPSDSREQRSDVGLHGIAAHSVLVSPRCQPFTFQFSTFTSLVSVAVTKHFCLTAVNRCGALCCPDFPHLSARQTGLLGAVYGNRTRLLGLGSRCTTDVLTPQFLNRPQNYCFFLNYANNLHLCRIFAATFFSCAFFRTRGVGGLPLRCPPSTCGRVILYRPSSLYHDARGYKRRGPARYRINAVVAPCGV